MADAEQAVAQAQTAKLPASVAPVANEVANQTALQLAVHQFTSEFGGEVVAFFER